MAECRVLIVEDETIVAMDLSATLRRLGCEVVATVDNGEAAIEAAGRHEPQLVLMDIRLKGAMDGIEAARTIHQRYGTPVVFLTAHGDTSTVDRSMGSAPYGYLVKPFDEGDLQRVISVALARSGAERHAQAQKDEALWETEEKLRTLLDSIHDYAIVMLDLEGRIVTWNAGAEKLTGYGAGEVIGRSFVMLRPENDRDEEDARRELEMIAETGRQEVEGWRMKKDGTRYWARVVRTPMRGRGGTLIGYVTVMHDETQRRTLEAQMLQSQKLESLGKLAGGVAHDFNNMLMVIFARTDLLLRVIGSAEQQRRYVTDIRTAAMKSRDLTQQLLAAARQQVLQPQVVNLNEILSSTLQLLGSSLGEHIAIHSHLDEHLWNIYADPGKLHQVLLNLCINAREAMPNGGSLTVETRNVRVDASYIRQHPHLHEGDYVQLLVSDTGSGIAPEIRDQIYDPFFSTRGRGSGLGLAVVRGIVEQTGGHIWFYSEVGRGTTFKLFFPRVGAEAHAREVEEAHMLPQRGQETILVVEDEQLVRTVLRETLEEQGYRVLVASRYSEAIAVTTPIDLLLTDVVLPDRNGRVLARAMRERQPALRVIYMSGYTDNAISDQGVLEPGVRFVEKPVATNVLLRTIRTALDAPPSNAV